MVGDFPLYSQMNDLSAQPIKKRQSLYHSKIRFILLLINMYGGTAG